MPLAGRVAPWARLVRIACVAVATIMVAALTVPSCGKSPAAPTFADYPYVRSADASPAWSRDGRWIAFHRRIPSSAGPAGLYVVSSAGGGLKFVAPGDFIWPEDISLSPDGSRLAFVSGFQLFLADVSGETYWSPLQTAALVRFTDWSPDGRTLIYRRTYMGSGAADADSSGLHALDLSSGTDAVVRADTLAGHGPVYAARYPSWSPDGSQIGFIETRSNGWDVVMIRADGSGYSVLSSSTSDALYDYLHWYSRPATGTDGLSFWQLTGPGSGPYFVDRDGCCKRRFAEPYSPQESFSADGEWVVETGLDPRDTTEVLFVRRFGDPTGASRRQLTTWDPPTGSTTSSVDCYPRPGDRAQGRSKATRTPRLASRD